MRFRFRVGLGRYPLFFVLVRDKCGINELTLSYNVKHQAPVQLGHTRDRPRGQANKHVPPGCRFHPRCRIAIDACLT